MLPDPPRSSVAHVCLELLTATHSRRANPPPSRLTTKPFRVRVAAPVIVRHLNIYALVLWDPWQWPSFVLTWQSDLSLTIKNDAILVDALQEMLAWRIRSCSLVAP